MTSIAKAGGGGRVAAMKSLQDFQRIERIVKGYANHKRLQVLELLYAKPDQTTDSISDAINSSYENTSDHLRKMSAAGLLYKRNDGPNVRYKLSPRAELVLAFCKKLK